MPKGDAVRDPAVFDEIARRLRHLWMASGSRGVCGLLHGAVDPAGDLDFAATSDAVLLRQPPEPWRTSRNRRLPTS